MPAVLSINSISTAEGNSSSHNALFTVTLDAPQPNNVSFSFATANGTATAGSDFTTRSGSLTIPSGQTSIQIPVPVLGDTNDEADENFFVNISNPVNATIGTGQGIATIQDDDGPLLSIRDASVIEGTGGSTIMSFRVDVTNGGNANGTSPQEVSVSFATSDGSAKAPGDYTAKTGTLTIPPGSPSGTITIEVKGDTLDEVNETFLVTLSNPVDATIFDGQGVGIINDDDGPNITISDASVLEGNSGLRDMIFQVSLSAVSVQDVRLNFATADNNATANLDYLPRSGLVTIPAGSTSATIKVPVLGDTLIELNETFSVNLTNPSHGILVKGTGIGTITDDDGPATLSISDVTVVEGDAGNVNAVFTVTLSAAIPQTVNVNFTTTDGTATVAGNDYVATAGTLTIPAGITSATITVPVKGDTLDEIDENFRVVLSNASNAVIVDDTGFGNITDDDGPGLSVNDVAITEGNAGTRIMTFTVTLSAVSPQPVTFSFSTADGTATAGVDYNSASGTLTILAGQNSASFNVTVNGDTLQEPDETFFVNLSNPVDAVLADAQGVGTIRDDDGPNVSVGLPLLSVGDVTVLETNSGNTGALFPIFLSFALPEDVTVNFSTADGSAVGNTDFTITAGSITIPAGQTLASVVVPVKGDTTQENNETFTLNLSNAINASILRPQGLGTIVDDDGSPAVSISDVSIREGNAGTTNIFFTIFLTGPNLTQDVTVNFATTDGTATGGSDFTAATGSVTIPAGATSRTIAIPVVGDGAIEGNETFFVNLTGVTNATIARAQGTATIIDDEAGQPVLSIGDITVREGNAGLTTATFTVFLAGGSNPNGSSPLPVSFTFATRDGSAVSPADYNGITSTPVTIPPGQLSALINVQVKGDVFVESNQDFFVDLANANNATLLRSSGRGLIIDDDGAPALSVGDVSLQEGDAGTTDAVFPVFLSQPSSQDVFVDFATVDGTTVAGLDYVVATGTLTIPAGQTLGNIVVAIIGDTLGEGNETFFVNLNNVANATIAKPQAVGTIIDEEGSPQLVIAPVQVLEGDSTTPNAAVFRVSLTTPSLQDITVNYTTANGTAIGGTDFAQISGVLIIPSGALTGDIVVPIIGDTIDEANETFFVSISNPTGGASIVAGATAQATIIDDDGPTLAINNVTVTEGNIGTITVNFALTLSSPSPQAITVKFHTVDGSTNPATVGSDYVGIPNGVLVIPAGAISANLPVQVVGDTLDEANETFLVVLDSAANAVLPPNTQGVGTINDDDSPTLFITSATTNEGDSGTSNLDFRVTVSGGSNIDGSSAQVITVNFATIDGTATSGVDYARVSGTLVIPANVAFLDLSVPIIGDTVPELNETFLVQLSGPTNATLAGTGTATGTIRDDDSTPIVTINDITILEGTGVTIPAVFTISLSQPSFLDVFVQVFTSNGTAVAQTPTPPFESDYVQLGAAPGTPNSGPVTVRIPAGQSSVNVSVAVNGDSLVEQTETFFLNVINPVNAVLPGSSTVIQGTANIIDNDGAVLSIGDITVTEGDTGTSSATFTVALSAPVTNNVVVSFDTDPVAAPFNTATRNVDYLRTSGILTIPSGSTTGTITVPIVGDVLSEPTEQFRVRLFNPVGATIVRVNGIGTILDNDGLQLSVGDASFAEGNSGFLNAFFTVSINAPSSKPTTVDFFTLDGSANSGLDYASTSGTVTIPAGETTAQIPIRIVGDTLPESNETFFVVLSNPTNASIARSTATGTIIDDDGAPAVSIGDAALAEGNSGLTDMVFTVSLSSTSSQTVTINFQTLDGSAVSSGNTPDYVVTSGALSIPAGAISGQIRVPIIGDTRFEPNETFQVRLTAASGGSLGRATATGTIIDDDGLRISVGDVTVQEGNPTTGAVVVSVPVFLSAATSRDVSIDFQTVGGTAGPVTDFVNTQGTITIPAGQTTGFIVVPIVNDVVPEPTEQFTIDLQANTAVNGSVLRATGTVTVADNDGLTMSIGDVTVTETNSGFIVASFQVFLSGPTVLPITVNFATADGSAVFGSDYERTTGQLMLPPGSTGATVDVRVFGDLTLEGNETFTVNLSGAVNVNILRGIGTGTILDNDGALFFDVGDLTILEDSTGGQGLIAVPVFLSGVSTQSLTVDFATQDGTAFASLADYMATQGRLTFNPGNTGTTIPVAIGRDTLEEPNENFFMNLSNVLPASSGVTIRRSGTITIINDDGAKITLSDVSIQEGNAGASQAIFTVFLDRALRQNVEIDFATASGTATSGVDFTGTSSTVIIPTGQLQATFNVPILGDFSEEGNETFTVNITDVRLRDPFTGQVANIGVNPAIVLKPTGLGVIMDNDGRPTLSIGDVSVVEGNGGTVNASFPVVLSFPIFQDVSVEFATANGIVFPATAGSDYLNTIGTLTIPAGQLEGTIEVPVVGDTLVENAETFFVNLSSLSANANLLDGQGQALIVDDDGAPAISLGDVSVKEGDAGTIDATFFVSLSAQSSQDVTVTFQTQALSATSGVDFIAVPPTILRINAGLTSGSITVRIRGDTNLEPNEVFNVVLSSPVNATIARGDITNPGVGVILDDDGVPAVSVGNVTVVEGSAGLTLARFPVQLTFASDQTVTVPFSTADGNLPPVPPQNAIAGADYNAAPAGSTLTFLPGETLKFIEIAVIADTLVENNEIFFVNLGTPTNAIVGVGTATGTIVNDDVPQPQISTTGVFINDVTIVEGDAGITNMVFTVSLSSPSVQAVTVLFHTEDGGSNPATTAVDYVPIAAGSLTIPAGLTSGTITVQVNGDLIDEADETLFVVLDDAVNGTVASGLSIGVGTIQDDDGPTLSVVALTPTVVEGSASTDVRKAIFRINVTGGGNPDGTSAQAVTVNYTTVNGTATGGLDFASIQGVLIIPAFTTSIDIPVPILVDTIDEANETFSLVLSFPTGGATIGVGSATTTIIDDDDPTVSINSVRVNEGNQGTVNATFTVSLSAASPQDVIVNFHTSDGSNNPATAGLDYQAVTGSLTIPAGQSVGTLTILVNGDSLDEVDETFAVVLDTAVNAVISTTNGQGLGTITDDDGPVLTMTAVPTVFTEGDSGTPTKALFRVLVHGGGNPDGSSPQPVQVRFATSDGTATGNLDYAVLTGTLIIPANSLFQDIEVPIIGDTIAEPDEDFFMTLSQPSGGATIDVPTAANTIIDDDPAPQIFIADASVAEGNSGTTAMTFTLSLSNPSSLPISVQFATADGNATSPLDFVAGSGVANFAPLQTTATVTVQVVGDVLKENDEIFFVGLSNPINASIASPTGTGTILDDDVAPGVTISDVSVVEGNAGTKDANFVVTLSAVSGQDVTIPFSTADGTATAGSDYVANASAIVIPAGSISRTITVTINGDTQLEPNETFFVNLGAVVNGSVADGQGRGTIVDDDGPKVFINDVAVTEGDSGTVNATFTVSLEFASPLDVSVSFATADGTATVVTGDYVSANGTVTIPGGQGQTTATVTVVVNGDLLNEVDETFFVNLSNPGGGVIADNQGVGTIINDDPVPGLSIDDVTVVEGNAGTVNATFTLTLAAPSGRPVFVDVATADDTALAGSDYTALTTTVSFAPGETVKTVTVPVLGDTLDEANETFFVNLSNPIAATITRPQGLGTILDQDGPAVSVSNTSVVEGNVGTSNALFTVSLSSVSPQDVTVNFVSSAGGSNPATAGTDFQLVTGSVTIPAGQASATFAVPVIGDTSDEQEETFLVTISGPVNGTIGTATAQGTIVDDDGPDITINDVTVFEGNTGFRTATFRISLSAPSPQAVSVTVATADGTATAPSDYTPLPPTVVTIPVGQTFILVDVLVAGDTIDEANESYLVNLSNAVNGTLADAQGVGSITDDDTAGTIQFERANFTANENGGSTATVVVTLTGSAGASVRFATANLRATAGQDYVATSGTLVFGANETTKTITVQILGDNLIEGNEAFRITLSNPTNGATLGAPSVAIVNILDNDGTGNARGVTQAYLDIFGRPVDNGGLTFFTGLLDTGAMSRTGVAQALLGSPEYLQNTVRAYYRFLLNREADPNGLAFWTQFLVTGRVEQFAAALVASPEYFQLHGGTNVSFLQSAYQDVFHRPIDQGGQDFFLGMLNSGQMTRATVANILLNSEEYFKHLVNFPEHFPSDEFVMDRVVHGLYQHFLNRDADAGGLVFSVNALKGGMKDEQLMAILLGSPEYFSGIPPG